MIINDAEIKDALNMQQALEALGVKVDRSNRAPCPVHNGSGKNFGVKGNKGTCFSQCSQTWDVPALIMELKNYTYPEAIEWMANQARIVPRYADNAGREEVVTRAKAEREAKAALTTVNAQALALLLPATPYEPEQTYTLHGRTWTGKVLSQFNVCIAPDSNLLTEHGERGALPLPQITELGLVRKSERTGTLYDAYRRRLIFPYYDERGNVVGFSARRAPADPDTSPKYINSPESLVFQKRSLLYGFWQARKTIHMSDMALVVEGMTDVLTCHQAGATHTVATGGTAFTPEMCRLIKSQTQNIVFCLDGDKAGENALETAVELAVAEGLKVRVVFLPHPSEEEVIERYDPDNYIRTHGGESFMKIVNEQAKDGLVWRAMLGWNAQDIFSQHACLQVAAEMIAKIGDEMIRDFYVRELAKNENFGKTAKSSLNDMVKEKISKALAQRNKPKFTGEQLADIVKYGIYTKDNQYFMTYGPDSEGYPITNFVINPIMLVVGSSESHRLCEVVNSFGQKFKAAINTDAVTEMAGFKKIVERMGNFLFLETAKYEHFVKIKRRMFERTPTCYPIHTLGYHKQDFYAWANGFTTPSGKFLPIDEHGVVKHGEHLFHMPALAQMNTDILADDADQSYEHQKGFIYYTETAGTEYATWPHWSSELTAVHGTNGMVAICFFLGAFFRDLIYQRLDFFPLLNMFGPPQTGKSFLGWSLSYMFGKARRPFNLHEGTDVSLFRILEQYRNAVAWLDEFSNDIHPRRVQALKNAYDGAGRTRAANVDSNRTQTSKVNSAIIVSGQSQATTDIALMTRFVCLSFNQSERTPEQVQRATDLRTLEQTGVFSRLTADLMQYRSLVDEGFDAHYDDARRCLVQIVEGRGVSDRLLNNYAILLASYTLLQPKLALAFNLSQILDALVSNMLSQSDSISKEDDLAVWWSILCYYYEKGQLLHEQDFIVQMAGTITVRKPTGKSTETEILDLGKEKKVLFLQFTKAFHFYQEQVAKTRGKGALNKEAIRYYLRASNAYLGEVRAKKFAGGTYSCYAFDMELLPFDFPLSVTQGFGVAAAHEEDAETMNQ